MNHIININENDFLAAISDDKSFKFLNNGYRELDSRRKLITHAIKDLKKIKYVYSANMALEKEIKSSVQEFYEYIEIASEYIDYKKKLLWAVIKKADKEFEDQYLSLVQSKPYLGMVTTKFILAANQDKLITIKNDEFLLTLLEKLSNENKKTYNSSFLYSMQKILKNDILLENQGSKISEVLENYQKNQYSLNREDFNFFKKNKVNILKLYENKSVPEFLHNLYENKSELKSELFNKTKKEIYEIFPNYFRKNSGIHISVKKEIELNNKTKKEILLDETKYPVVIVEFDTKRFAANNVSDSVHLTKMFRVLAKRFEEKCKANELELNDFVYTEKQSHSMFLLGFTDEKVALKLKEIVDSFIIKIANDSMKKTKPEYQAYLNIKTDLDKYFSYFILTKELEEEDKHSLEIKSLNKRLKI